MEDAGIELDWVATDVLGASGRAMLATLVAGQRDTGVLAELANGRLRAKLPLLLPSVAASCSCRQSFCSTLGVCPR